MLDGLSGIEEIVTIQQEYYRVVDCMERRFNIYSIIWRYLQIFEDIFK